MSKARKRRTKGKPAKGRSDRVDLLGRNLSRLEVQIGDVQRAVEIAMLMISDEEHRERLGLFAVEEAHTLAEKLWTSFLEAHAAAVAGKEWTDL